MPWQCRLVAADKYPKETGDMWEGEVYTDANHGGYFCDAGKLSDEYVRDRMAQRKPLLVLLPGPVVFGIDSAVSGETRGWQVSGEAPNITVSPSINCIGQYHGWLRGGIISDDCEGRRF